MAAATWVRPDRKRSEPHRWMTPGGFRLASPPSGEHIASMVGKRRVGAESSATRARIVEATEEVIREQGYGAASTRRVAQRAGLKASLVHYYFPTTEDLVLAVFKRGAA